jgi:hypothetical protein
MRKAFFSLSKTERKKQISKFTRQCIVKKKEKDRRKFLILEWRKQNAINKAKGRPGIKLEEEDNNK